MKALTQIAAFTLVNAGIALVVALSPPDGLPEAMLWRPRCSLWPWPCCF